MHWIREVLLFKSFWISILICYFRFFFSSLAYDGFQHWQVNISIRWIWNTWSDAGYEACVSHYQYKMYHGAWFCSYIYFFYYYVYCIWLCCGKMKQIHSVIVFREAFGQSIEAIFRMAAIKLLPSFDAQNINIQSTESRENIMRLSFLMFFLSICLPLSCSLLYLLFSSCVSMA